MNAVDEAQIIVDKKPRKAFLQALAQALKLHQSNVKKKST
jgi:hypothetical protein